MNKLIIAFLIFGSNAFCQSFAPAPGNPGSTAIFKDSSIIIDWASDVTISRGLMNVLNVSAGIVSYGVDSDAVGSSSGATVSLGDGGVAIATFDSPIVNGVGPDFAIFENGFADDYLELAFVEVSSDGINYFRFPATSEIPIDIQSGNFTFTDCRYVNNLAGKYRLYYGTPFDLQELVGTPGLDIDNITHVKIIDVIGSIDPNVGSFDAFGTIINDPFPTEFESGGFDLTAIGVIHSTTESLPSISQNNFRVYPNPTLDKIVLESSVLTSFELIELSGGIILNGEFLGELKLDLSQYKTGIYFLCMGSEKGQEVIKVKKL